MIRYNKNELWYIGDVTEVEDWPILCDNHMGDTHVEICRVPDLEDAMAIVASFNKLRGIDDIDAATVCAKGEVKHG